MIEDEGPIGGTDPEDAAQGETEYPKAPGASKMEALRRIERGLEEQSKQTPDREPASDARKDEEGAAVDAEGQTGESAE